MTKRVQILAGVTLLLGAYGLKLGVSKTSESAPLNDTVVTATQDKKPQSSSAAEIVVYTSDLPESALSEFDVWKDPASPGGTLIGTVNRGGDLDPPPEDDPHVTFKVKVQSGVNYRCWVHMKVGTPKGVSKANKVWVQFSDAVDKAGKQVLKPGSSSFLTAEGPEKAGWVWTQAALENAKSPDESLVRFQINGEVTVRIQAGMEGVGFDQIVLSPARYLEKPPVEMVVKKTS